MFMKGIRSVVLERSETLRVTGAAIGIRANGWRALDQLGIASHLRKTTPCLKGSREIQIDKGSNKEVALESEARCLKRSELIKTLADALAPGTIHFGCQIISLKLDPVTSYPILQLLDGRSIAAKVLVGCDGGRSVVADFLGLKPTKNFGLSALRGLTNYPNGHGFNHEIVRMRCENIMVGRVPVDDKSVYWFVSLPSTRQDHAMFSKHPELIREVTLQSISAGFPPEIAQMLKDSELDSLSFSHLWYRAPWDLLLATFKKGTVTVAGDAMHVMGPFLGQGGSAGLEDAVVLARCLSQKCSGRGESVMIMDKIGEAIDQYVEERRMRVVQLSTQTYLIGMLSTPSSSLLLKLACVVLIAIVFRNPTNHTTYDCGRL